MDDEVTVYEFELFDRVARRWKRSERRGTVEAITKAGGVALQSTALVIDSSRLDGDGFVPPPAG